MKPLVLLDFIFVKWLHRVMLAYSEKYKVTIRDTLIFILSVLIGNISLEEKNFWGVILVVLYSALLFSLDSRRKTTSNKPQLLKDLQFIAQDVRILCYKCFVFIFCLFVYSEISFEYLLTKDTLNSAEILLFSKPYEFATHFVFAKIPDLFFIILVFTLLSFVESKEGPSQP